MEAQAGSNRMTLSTTLPSGQILLDFRLIDALGAVSDTWKIELTVPEPAPPHGKRMEQRPAQRRQQKQPARQRHGQQQRFQHDSHLRAYYAERGEWGTGGRVEK